MPARNKSFVGVPASGRPENCYTLQWKPGGLPHQRQAYAILRTKNCVKFTCDGDRTCTDAAEKSAMTNRTSVIHHCDAILRGFRLTL